MGSFYLDIIKDRQYTTKTNSRARRSAQTAVYHILEALVRWFAPILSFTAEEIWRYMPGERDVSVFTQTWYDALVPNAADVTMNAAFWQEMMLVREAVNKTIETQKASGQVNSAMEADVTLVATGALKEKLQRLGDELRFVLITSNATLGEHSINAVETGIAGLSLTAVHSSYQKCSRCWQCRADVGVTVSHPSLCSRCVANVETGEGEERLYA
jgi:isoleucyl-tRNA synthetase